MPPYRQPTPSPPPPPIEDEIPSSTTTAATTMTILERADPGRSSGGVDADAAGTATTGFEIPPNFVPPPPPREVGKFLPIPPTSHFAHLPISARSPRPAPPLTLPSP